MRFLNKNIISN